MIETCAAFGVAADRRDGHPGCWCDPEGAAPRKIGALGLRVERGVELPRHRPQRDVDLARLRPDRPVRDARRRARRPSPRERGLDRAPRRRRRPRVARGRRGLRRATLAALARARRSAAALALGAAGRRRPGAMSRGLFELRKDAITGWWVATVVDRAFDRDRFAPRRGAGRRRRRLPNCRIPPGDGVRTADPQGLRVHVAGTEEEARELDGQRRPGRARARRGPRAAGGPSSRRLASTGRCTPSAPTSSRACSPARRDAIAEARDGGPDRATSRSSRTGARRRAPGPTTCASTSTTCRRSRTGSRRSSAARRGS